MTFSPVSILFVVLLLAAAGMDFAQQRIPNAIVVAIVAVFFVQALRHLHSVAWLSQFGAGGACLAAGVLLFGLGQLGAGDAKLLASVALWSGFKSLVLLILFVSLSGLVLLAALLGVRRWLAWRRWQPANLPKSLMAGEGVPYGVAIAAGTLMAMAGFPNWLWS